MGWIGTIFTLVGVWVLTDRIRLALLLLIAGNVCWAIEGVLIEKPDLIVINSALLLLALRNLLRCGNSSKNNCKTTVS